MSSNIGQQNWASMPPFAQLAYNKNYSTTTHDAVLFRIRMQSRMPVDIILGISHRARRIETNAFSHQTQKRKQINQLTFELARRDLTDKHRRPNKTLPPYTAYKPGVQAASTGVAVLTPPEYRWPQTQIAHGWRGPYVLRAQHPTAEYKVQKKINRRAKSIGSPRQPQALLPAATPTGTRT